MQGSSEEEEEYDFSREPEPDKFTLQANEKRSRYFLAVMCFLLAFLCLSMFLNQVSTVNGMLLALGAIVFGAIGAYFLLHSDTVKQPLSSDQGESSEEDDIWSDELSDEGDAAGGSSREDKIERDQVSFELLVQEALSSLPEEFQARMENVLVSVEYAPGAEVLKRVGIKRGYTLLGLYEGVPLTTYGRGYASYPEVITIYQRTIEAYCHGDPQRIREQVRHTVLHELAHHFGIDHEEMPIWIR